MTLTNDEPYVIFEQIGNCKICQSLTDLRMGVCFDHAGQVDGEQISETTHKLWDVKNPKNVWYYSETGH